MCLNQVTPYPLSACLIMTSGEQRRSLDEFEDDFDPDLDISKGRDRVWLVKLPKWLMEHWSKTDQDNVELASINIPYIQPRTRKLANSYRTNSSITGSVNFPINGSWPSLLTRRRTSSLCFLITQLTPISRKSSPSIWPTERSQIHLFSVKGIYISKRNSQYPNQLYKTALFDTLPIPNLYPVSAPKTRHSIPY